MKINFENDYSSVAHKRVLEKLLSAADESNFGYGNDSHSKTATNLIKKQMKYEDCDIYYLSGGTAVNKLVITSFLKPFEAVICAETGHINVHETGAIEAGGHKVLTVKTNDGKLTTNLIEPILDEHNSSHMVKPKMVYISNTTELGGVYTKLELKRLKEFCTSRGVYLYVDGARLGSALCSTESDLTLEDLPYLCDVFYIGGTKSGALYGEALVLVNDDFKADMPYRIKNLGMLFAKGFNTALQFEALFEDGLFFDIAKHENKLSRYLYDELDELGFDFKDFWKSNQIFVIMDNNLIKKLYEKFSFIIWEKFDESSSVVRLVISFKTKKEDCDSFLKCVLNNMD